MKSSFINVLTALAFSALASTASAVLTVTTSAGIGEPHFISIDGTTPLADGMSYQLGTFPSGTDLSQASGSPAALYSQFQPFATDSVYTHPISLEGGSAGNDVYGLDTFSMQPAYWWVFQTSNGLVPAGDFSNVTGQALFTGASGSWSFPTTGVVAAPPVFSTADTITLSAGSLAGGNIQLAVVPEPAISGLTLLAGAIMLRRKRNATS
jgi:hypothetical protein